MRLMPIFGWYGLLAFAIISVAVLAMLSIQFWPKRKNIKARQHFAVRCGIILLLFTMVVGISVPGETSPPGMLNLDVVFAVDTTASMGAEDYDGKKLRIEAVRADLLALSEHFKGARLSLMTFDTSEHLLLPYTSDSSAFQTAALTMNREIYAYSNGSSIDKPISALEKQLKSSQASHPKRGRLLFYLGDGEQTASKPPVSFSSLAPYIKGGLVMGYGTTQGGKMRKYSGFAGIDTYYDGQYITELNKTTFNWDPAVSKINEDNLKNIAQQLKVGYQKREAKQDIASLVGVSKADQVAETSREVTHYRNLYWIFASVATLLVCFELLYVIRYRRNVRGNHHE